MPIAPLTNGINQVLPNPGVQPFAQQQNFGQMIGECLDANPSMDSSAISVRLNGIVRKIYDRRMWYGLMVRGQILNQGYVIGGSASVTLGSNQVVGAGTSWTPAIIGRQFRIGYNTPLYTITQLNVGTQTLTLEMPWGGTSYSGSGYIISQNYVSPGSNIKYIHTAKNMMMAWRLRLDYNQQSLDTIDPWRINTFSPSALVQMPPGPNGEYMVELWPCPNIVQALPFIAAVQPPNLVNDTDSLPAYIRTDIVTKLGRADALVYRGPKLNPYYDMVESQRLRAEAEEELNFLALNDESLYRSGLQYEWESMRLAPEPGLGGANWAINHGVAAGGMEW